MLDRAATQRTHIGVVRVVRGETGCPCCLWPRSRATDNTENTDTFRSCSIERQHNGATSVLSVLSVAKPGVRVVCGRDPEATDNTENTDRFRFGSIERPHNGPTSVLSVFSVAKPGVDGVRGESGCRCCPWPRSEATDNTENTDRFRSCSIQRQHNGPHRCCPCSPWRNRVSAAFL